MKIDVDNFVALSGPNRIDYKLTGNNVKNYMEIYDSRDSIKRLFAAYDNWSIAFGVTGLLLSLGLTATAQMPMVSKYANSSYDISKNMSLLQYLQNTDPHQTSRIWDNIKDAFNKKLK